MISFILLVAPKFKKRSLYNLNINLEKGVQIVQIHYMVIHGFVMFLALEQRTGDHGNHPFGYYVNHWLKNCKSTH